VGLAGDLSYAYARPNAFQRAMQAVASTRPGAWFFAKTLASMDRLLDRISKGRLTVPALMAGLPVLVLTSTGRRSGQPRQTHLIAVPYLDTLALLGTNFGQPTTPTWVLNLEAEPRASVTHGGQTRQVVARPAWADERVRILAESANFYAGYAKYQERITGRTLRIFVLEAPPPDEGPN
jgi:deazaflavin-dependent oxidoreductase (nitroreductase family)